MGVDGTTQEVATVRYRRRFTEFPVASFSPTAGGPKNTAALVGARRGMGHAKAVLAADGSFSFAGVPEDGIRDALHPNPGLSAGQQSQPFPANPRFAVAMFVDADKSGLELYFQPEAAKQATKTDN